MKKIAIFETSDIFFIHWNVTNDLPAPKSPAAHIFKASFEDSHGTHKVYSTGALERALEQGYKVYVASTRTRMGDHDAWWISLVGEDAVFLAREPSPAHYHEDRNAAISAGWMGVYKEVGIPWPERDGEPEFWTTARHMLSEHGVDLGADFK